MQYRIFLVEDDPVISRTVKDYLTRLGYLVAQGQNLADLTPEFTAFAPQLVLLDLSLPYRNGYHWCRVFRELSQLPIVFLSSAADNLNIVTAMELGADDYIPKPFDLEVLGAKVQALLRRAYAYGRPADLVDCGGGVVLDLGSGVLKTASGPVELTRNEQKILWYLFRHAGTICARADLVDFLWDNQLYIDDNALSVHISRIREKLASIGLTGFIQTKHRQGYLI